MRVVVQNTLTNRQWVGFDGTSGFIIGRDGNCDVKLDSRFVSAMHARVERAESGWEMELLPGVNAVEIDGKEFKAGQKAPLRDSSSIRLMEFVLTLEDTQAQAAQGATQEQMTELQNLLHANVLRRLDLRVGAWQTDFSGDRTEQLNRIVDDLLLGEFKSQVFESALTPLIISRAFKTRLGEWIFKRMTREQKITSSWNVLGVNADMESTLESTITRVAAKAGIVEGKPIPANAEDLLDAQFDRLADSVATDMLENVRIYLIISYLKKVLYDMIFGLGPLEDLLRSPSITEIMVVSPTQIYIERGGRISKVAQTFPSEESAVSIIERIVAPLGRRIDRSRPLVDARLRDGSRVNAIIEPLAIKGPCITIRKFPVFRVSVDDLIRWRSISNSAVELLRACVLMRCNMLISGGTGSGKTTLLNVLSGMIPAVDRLVTIEDSAELRLQQEHVVSLETKPANAEGAGEYTVRDLVKNALRMRPDRIIVGECRGAEAIDMLQAMNTGHRGSMTTIHSNNAHDAISRLETMVLMGAEIPLPAVRRQIASAIHVIVHTERQPNGQRLVSQVSEVIGLHPVTGEVESRDIMQAQEVNGTLMLRPTGYMPSFLGEMVERRYLHLQSWFDQVRSG
jgi:pilus assembly protein CpaF